MNQVLYEIEVSNYTPLSPTEVAELSTLSALGITWEAFNKYPCLGCISRDSDLIDSGVEPGHQYLKKKKHSPVTLGFCQGEL